MPRLVMNDKMEIIRITSDNIELLAYRSGFSEKELRSAMIQAEASGGQAYVRLGLPWK